MSTFALLAKVLQDALQEVRQKAIPVYTFALYHDHESGAVSVCVDTQENSRRTVVQMNCYNMKYFMGAVRDKDLKTASLWQANTGRSLSLGDFTLVNSARVSLGSIKTDATFYLTMVEAMVDVQSEIAELSPDPERLVFACSGPDDEVAYVWSLPSSA
jgi:hypothetical protein